MDRAVVLEVEGDRAVVLVRGAQFRRIRLDGRSISVGQEIEVPALTSRRFWPVLARPRLVALVACMLIAVLLPAGYFEFLAPRPALASVCIDISTTVELGIDVRGKVVEARGVGSEGETLLQGLEWHGKHVDEVIVELVRLSADKGLVQSDPDLHLLLTVIPAEGKTIPPGLEKKIVGLQAAVETRLSARSIQAPVTVLRGDGDLKKVAEQLEMSPGKIAVMLEAREGGLDITVEEIRQERIAKAIPRAGGKLPEILEKAQQRKNWTKLLEKYKEETGKPKGKKGQSLEPDVEKADGARTAGPDTTKEGPRGSAAPDGQAHDARGQGGSQGRTTGRKTAEGEMPERETPDVQTPDVQTPDRPGSPSAGKKIIVRRNGTAVQWYANRLDRKNSSVKPSGLKKVPGPKGEKGETGP
ncbi:MAG: anti-sigma factor domain-containing protein [Bacillota bacterium]|nr:anti-sigma factor domain-containing protein [Bacillota bacterium]